MFQALYAAGHGACALVFYITHAMIGRNITNHSLEKKKSALPQPIWRQNSFLSKHPFLPEADVTWDSQDEGWRQVTTNTQRGVLCSRISESILHWSNPEEQECYSDNKVPALSWDNSVHVAQTWQHWRLLPLWANLWSTSNPRKWSIPISSVRWGTTLLPVHKEEQEKMNIKLLLCQSKSINAY